MSAEPSASLQGPLPERRTVRKAVILAAGRGRRMGARTADRPKAALEVGGHALVDWQISALRAAGVEQIAIVTGHAAGALAGRDAAYIHNPNWQIGTQVETLLRARDWIGDDPVLVSYGDILYHPSAALALLERPGDIVVAYDADHRWLWKRRFGDWLKDSETFRLAAGQVLAEIGGNPTDIEEVEGQFMGLMLLTSAGLDRLANRHQTLPRSVRLRTDFTALLALLLQDGETVATAANILPWMETDTPKDLKIAARMATADPATETPATLQFAANLEDGRSGAPEAEEGAPSLIEDIEPTHSPDTAPWDAARLRPYVQIVGHEVANAFAVQNWGRSGSTFLQSLFDDHPQVLSTPNFYSRGFYLAWARRISLVPDDRKIDVFLNCMRQWWDRGMVDATAGLHRLGPDRNELAGVDREALEGHLRAAFASGRSVTRRNLFAAAHLSYALARGQKLAAGGLQIMFPIHSRSRAVAAALLEDFPDVRLIHTVREPIANVASSLQHTEFNHLDIRRDALETTLAMLFDCAPRSPSPVTQFSDRPFFGHLASRDKSRFLRLEDLHRHGGALMRSVCRWLDLKDHAGLLVSTWDGRLWWNRPESGRESCIGGQHLDRNVHRLMSGDRRKVALIVRRTEALRLLYPTSVDAPLTAVGGMAAAAIPWQSRRNVRAGTYRSLEALRGLSTILPKTLVERIDLALAYERRRARLLSMTSGAIYVRRRLPDAKRSSTINAILLVGRVGGDWRTRLLVQLPKRDLQDLPDNIAVGFMDRAVSDVALADHAFWLFVLSVGGPLARIITYIRMRMLMARLVFTPRSSGHAQPLFSFIPALPTNTAP